MSSTRGQRRGLSPSTLLATRCGPLKGSRVSVENTDMYEDETFCDSL